MPPFFRPPLFLAALLTACAPDAAPPAPQATAVVPVSESSGAPPQASPSPSPAVEAPPAAAAPRLVETRLGGISVTAVRFDSRSHHLVVADQPDGPGSRWPDSRAAGEAFGGLAAFNGGFFTPAGGPLGLVVASGQRRGAFNSASSLAGGFFVEENDGRLALVRRAAFSGGRQAIQTGPFLVENGRPVRGLSEEISTARTFVGTDGRHGWIVARTGPASLAHLGKSLAGAEIGGVRIRTALNLDGGRSSELWASPQLPGGPAFIRPLWNKPVRNFLILKRR